ncbi:hypothetical protein SARC_02749 [Sphaeroforma arctica JP610]|uniref:folate gamma-glutamyl hydrolase n=1 Tax=Sphaeroforma arctica JP610 TaxID=667725 RepID=A0A0L0G839_9EUKA|nr:hypothetical protein SARC_02749 [Sphaeroforma arctica JP610]KNC85056.1 hypothetical protein SARC_02749 [Sphaeroforma arctica JP610]|eukprot:XP_014158958.1 hypothetical protein SARC_02749 [Sphaeroforma arctica JP610]
MLYSIITVAVCLVSSVNSVSLQQVNTNLPDGVDRFNGPVIGVLAEPYCISLDPKKAGFNHGCEQSPQSGVDVWAYKYLEAAGARVIGIPYNIPEAEVHQLFDQMHGVYFPGGDASLEYDSQYYKTANILFKRAKEANDAGIHFPILGICMGFQLLTVLQSQDYSVLEHGVYDSHGVLFQLERTEETQDSRLLGQNAPKLVTDHFYNTPSTANFHYDGITMENYAKNEHLNEFYRVVSTNHDLKGRPFVSTVEAYDYPFYGLQWHPEGVQFSWSPHSMFVDRTMESIMSVQYLANFFIGEARKCSHPNVDNSLTLDSLYLYNQQPVIKGNSSAVYLFVRDNSALDA